MLSNISKKGRRSIKIYTTLKSITISRTYNFAENVLWETTMVIVFRGTLRPTRSRKPLLTDGTTIECSLTTIPTMITESQSNERDFDLAVNGKD